MKTLSIQVVQQTQRGAYLEIPSWTHQSQTVENKTEILQESKREEQKIFKKINHAKLRGS